MGFANELHEVVVDAEFDARGTAAIYVPPGGGTPIDCVVARDLRDGGAAADDGRPLAGQMTVIVRKSELAAPKKGGVFTLTETATTLTVANRPLIGDPEGYTWSMWVE